MSLSLLISSSSKWCWIWTRKKKKKGEGVPWFQHHPLSELNPTSPKHTTGYKESRNMQSYPEHMEKMPNKATLDYRIPINPWSRIWAAMLSGWQNLLMYFTCCHSPMSGVDSMKDIRFYHCSTKNNTQVCYQIAILARPCAQNMILPICDGNRPSDHLSVVT